MDLRERVAEMRDFFNEKASGFDAVHQALMSSKIAAADAVPDSARRVLDLGAGTGMELVPLFERLPEVHVTAVDVSENALFYLRQRPFADRVETLCGDFFEIDPGTGYDAILSTSTLHHFTPEDKVRLYKRCFSFLKPGGLWINVDKCASSVGEEAAGFTEYETNRAAYRHFDTPLAPVTEEDLLRAAGFVPLPFEPVEGTAYVKMCAVQPDFDNT